MTNRPLALVAILGVASGAGSTSVPAEELPSGFSLESVVTGLFEGEPTAFAFLPDGRLLLAERETGRVLLAPLFASEATPVHTLPDLRTGIGERGLLGMAVDPAWPVRPYLYFYYTHVSEHAYVTMFTAGGDLLDPLSPDLSLSDPYHLLTDAPDELAVHHGGTLRFGPLDGMLYLTVGDNVSPCESQTLSLMNGKLLRLDVSGMPGSGPGPPLKTSLAPADNPFPGPDENERLVFAYGLRNPFRFTIDPWTGDVFVADVGENHFEEVDTVPFGGGGQNFGWPEREGFVVLDPPVVPCDPIPSHVDPIYAYAHELPTANAIIGGPLYRSDPFAPYSFPPEYDGDYFFVDHVKGFLRRIEETPNGWTEAPPVLGQPSATNWGEEIYFVSDLQQGPDGAIYLMKRYAPGGGPGSEHPPGLYRIVRDLSATGVAAGSVRGPAPIRVVPNPARAGATVSILGVGTAPVSIHDVRGRLVRRIASDARGNARWNGRDDRGAPARTGTYFVRAGDGRATRITVLR